jgi:sensor c-di-GMP phosphodiesterase-like protein
VKPALKPCAAFAETLRRRAVAAHRPAALRELGAGDDFGTEGIGTPDRAERLRAGGCRLGQGFRFAAPEPAARMSRHLDQARAGMMPA